MKKIISFNRAFTLIELMVVVAIIALLTGILMSNFAQSRAKARDTKRISDLGNLQVTLELFFDRCKQYPANITAADLTTVNNNCPAGINLGTYISKIPTDPTTAQVYQYFVDSSNSNNNYVLHTTLEVANDVVRDALPSAPSFSSGITCGNASGTKEYCLGPK